VDDDGTFKRKSYQISFFFITDRRTLCVLFILWVIYMIGGGGPPFGGFMHSCVLLIENIIINLAPDYAFYDF
jgi:hypothetical protein